VTLSAAFRLLRRSSVGIPRREARMPTLSISSEKVCYLIVKFREFDAQDVETDPDDSSSPTDDRMLAILEAHADDPVAQEIRDFVEELNDDEQADLLALLRLGRGDGTMAEWEGLRDEAEREYQHHIVAYLLGQPLVGDYLEDALSQFGFSCAEFEIDRL
jgi:hypothetical protein